MDLDGEGCVWGALVLGHDDSEEDATAAPAATTVLLLLAEFWLGRCRCVRPTVEVAEVPEVEASASGFSGLRVVFGVVVAGGVEAVVVVVETELGVVPSRLLSLLVPVLLLLLESAEPGPWPLSLFMVLVSIGRCGGQSLFGMWRDRDRERWCLIERQGRRGQDA